MKQNNQFKHLKEIERVINKNLYKICGMVTIVAMAMALMAFFTRGLFPPANINIFYLSVLIIYSLHKELVRWLGEKEVERQGEYFVYGWVILTTSLYIINFFTKGYFSYPVGGFSLTAISDTSLLCLEVLAVFIFTRAFKILKVPLTKLIKPK